MAHITENYNNTKKIAFKPSNELKERLHYTMTNPDKRGDRELLSTKIAVISFGLIVVLVITITIAEFIGMNI